MAEDNAQVVDEQAEATPEVVEALEQLGGDVHGTVTEPNPDSLDQLEAQKPTEETEKPVEQEQSTEPVESEGAPKDEVEDDTAGVYQPETVDDPGDFKPGDYSFTVTTTDGKTHTIKTPEDAEAFAQLIDSDPSLITAAQLLALNRGTTRMDLGTENDKRTWEAAKTQFDAVKAQNDLRDTTLVEINNGMKYLESKGLIPPVAKELDSKEAGARWGTDYKDEPGVKERLEILKYMGDENERRLEAGLMPSFDVSAAYNALQLEKLQKQAQETDQTESDMRRQRGAMVGGQAHYAPEPPRSSDIVGIGGSLDELLTQY